MLNLTYAKGKETAEEFFKRFEEKMQQTKRVMKMRDTEVIKNLLMSVKNCVPVIGCFNASNGTLSYGNLKIILLNEKATEAEAKNRSGEGEPMVVLNAETTIKNKKHKATM